MKLLTTALLTIALLVAQPALAVERCSAPTGPGIPDGVKAAEKDMIVAQKAVKAYMDTANAYLACLTEAEGKLGNDEEALMMKAAMIESHNQMVDNMEAVASQFNVALRAYKAKQ
jgi:hypothetical protein